MVREIDKVDEGVVRLAACLFDGVVRVMAEAEENRGGEVDTLLDCLAVLLSRHGVPGSRDGAARLAAEICMAIAAGVHLGRFDFIHVDGGRPGQSV